MTHRFSRLELGQGSWNVLALGSSRRSTAEVYLGAEVWSVSNQSGIVTASHQAFCRCLSISHIRASYSWESVQRRICKIWLWCKRPGLTLWRPIGTWQDPPNKLCVPLLSREHKLRASIATALGRPAAALPATACIDSTPLVVQILVVSRKSHVAAVCCSYP